MSDTPNLDEFWDLFKKKVESSETKEVDSSTSTTEEVKDSSDTLLSVEDLADMDAALDAYNSSNSTSNWFNNNTIQSNSSITFTSGGTIPYITSGGGSASISIGGLAGSGLSSSSWDTSYSTSTQVLNVKGAAHVDGDIVLNGKSLSNSIDKIEEKLAILHPNEAMEERWEKLRDLRRQYIEMEKEIVEQEKMWDILKK